MQVKQMKTNGSWNDVLNSARSTVGKDSISTEPNQKWKIRMLMAEHSPIRRLTLSWKWTGLMYWVSVHITRHKIGIEHFVKTQRSDRTGQDRYKKPQDSLVDHEIVANPQAIINISRKRLCFNSSAETREAWIAALKELSVTEPELFSVCVPECIYRGFCPEMESCGFSESTAFKRRLEMYRKPILDWRKEDGKQKM